jgi:hypothetical protein
VNAPADRTAAKRRASYARADRLTKEAARDVQRTADREKAEQQRKAEAIKAVEQRNAQARKRAEQRRLDRHKENIRKQFTRAAEDRAAKQARAEQQRKAVKTVPQREQDEKRREAETYVRGRQKRQQADQQAEHRRQTDRLRVEQQSRIRGYGEKNNSAIDQHARHVRNIDIAERRDLAALNRQRNSLTGRAVSLVRGAKHYDRHERAITDRHEAARWDKHRDLEAKKDGLFWSEQATRLRHASGRMTMMQQHRDERRDLIQAHDRSRPQQIEAQRQALIRANDNAPTKKLENVRTTDAFQQAAERTHERTR